MRSYSLMIAGTVIAALACGASAQISRPKRTVTPPSEVRPGGSDLTQPSIDEKTKTAINAATKSRAYIVRARIRYVGEPSFDPGGSPFRVNRASAFCDGANESTPFVVIYVDYEWRPADDFVPNAFVVVRRASDEIRSSVTLQSGSGTAVTGGGGFASLFTLSKDDICPSGCTEVHLAAQRSADTNRFDQRWVRACL